MTYDSLLNKTLETSQDPYVAHMADSIEELSTRIGRLSIAIGLNLRDAADVHRIMQTHDASPQNQDRWLNGYHQDYIGAGKNPDRRVAHVWEELRGLLVMRYDLEKQFVETAGAVTVRKVLEEIELKLVRQGFDPGEDGSDLNRLT